MATRRATSPTASLRRMHIYIYVAMADFRDHQSDEEGFESDGSLHDNIIGLWEKEKARATQVKKMP